MNEVRTRGLALVVGLVLRGLSPTWAQTCAAVGRGSLLPSKISASLYAPPADAEAWRSALSRLRLTEPVTPEGAELWRILIGAQRPDLPPLLVPLANRIVKTRYTPESIADMILRSPGYAGWFIEGRAREVAMEAEAAAEALISAANEAPQEVREELRSELSRLGALRPYLKAYRPEVLERLEDTVRDNDASLAGLRARRIEGAAAAAAHALGAEEPLNEEALELSRIRELVVALQHESSYRRSLRRLDALTATAELSPRVAVRRMAVQGVMDDAWTARAAYARKAVAAVERVASDPQSKGLAVGLLVRQLDAARRDGYFEEVHAALGRLINGQEALIVPRPALAPPLPASWSFIGPGMLLFFSGGLEALGAAVHAGSFGSGFWLGIAVMVGAAALMASRAIWAKRIRSAS